MDKKKTKLLKKAVKSTINIDMIDPVSKRVVGIGAGCIIRYRNKEILLSVQHVTDKEAVTCIDTGTTSSDGKAILYSVGSIYYLGKLNFSHDKNKMDEEVYDFCFTFLDEDIDLIQTKISFNNDLQIKQGKKDKISTQLTDLPNQDDKFTFFGRIKPNLYPNTIHGELVFETDQVLYDGLKYIDKIDYLYLFNLPNSKKKSDDFKGTSGAPIFDSKGNLVALVKGNNGDVKTITGVAIADFKSLIDCAIDNHKLQVESEIGN